MLRQRDLDLKTSDWGRAAHTSMTRWQHAVTVSLNLTGVQTWFFIVFSDLCCSSLLICCLKWSYTQTGGGDLLMMFPGYDELLGEDSRTNWRISVLWEGRSPQVELSSTELEMIWREITIIQTLTRGRILWRNSFRPFNVGSNQNRIPAWDNLLAVT